MKLPNTCRGKSVCQASEVATIFKGILSAEDADSREREHFWALGLNTKNNVKYIELVSLGSLTASLVHPRELFRLAIVNGCAALIVCHNHPSGDTKPSQEDIILTRRIHQASEILGIQVLDHVIIGEGYFSFRDNGLMASK